ncbi:GNAT family N-acetyltransferase [Pseudomonadota bacterium]
MISAFDSSHVRAVAELHLENLTGLLRELGPGATYAFYHGAARSNSAVGFVYIAENQVLGFIFGSTNPALLRREVLGHSFFRTLIGIASGILRKPGNLRFLLSSLLPKEKQYDTEIPELTYLAVGGRQRTSGIGRQLVEHFGQELKASGLTAYELSVDHDNRAAIGFYERLGFQDIGGYSEFGIEHRRYRLELG